MLTWLDIIGALLGELFPRSVPSVSSVDRAENSSSEVLRDLEKHGEAQVLEISWLGWVNWRDV